jgi:hypothetical protein
MATLGLAERIEYEAINQATGLTNIVAYVTRPDLVVTGPYPMVEFQSPFFKGIYYFDYVTTESFPVGNYLFVVSSPTEGTRPPRTLRFDAPITVTGGGSGSTTIINNNTVQVDLDGVVLDASDNLVGEIESVDELDGTVETGDPGQVDGIIHSDP